MSVSRELYKKQLDNFKELVVDIVTTAFNKDGGIHPLMLCLNIHEGRFEVSMLANLGQLFYDPSTREEAKTVMQDFIKDRKAIVIALAVEAVAKKYEGGYDPESSKEADEVSNVMMATFETYDSESVIIWDVDRSNPDRPTMLINTDKDWAEKEKGEGFFNDILQEDYSELAEEIRKMMNN
jgi:hypothetical protein